ncbi:MAG: amino acid adenylation domain-containing protein [Deltaproteobacteria bacterium]|nr:amino acid adenylation domain-containing protein [Deltaproteobacteria bacterium]
MNQLDPTTRAENLVDLSQERAEFHGDETLFTFLNPDLQRSIQSPSGESASEESASGTVVSRQLSFAELDRQARAVATALQAECTEGDRVLVALPAGLEFIVALFGCFYAGVVAVPAHPPTLRRQRHRLRALAQDCGARLMLREPKGERTTEAPELADLSLPQRSLGELLAAGVPKLSRQWGRPRLKREGLAFLQYTSGSTGEPRGVMVTHGSLMDNLRRIRHGFGLRQGDIVGSWLPPHHDMGLVGGILEPLFSGLPAFLSSPQGFLQRPVSWLETIERHGITVSGAPDFAYRLCCRRVSEQRASELDLSSWRVAFNGAEPVLPTTLEEFGGHFTSAGFSSRAWVSCYGLAEATLLVSASPPGSSPKLVSVVTGELEQHRLVIPSDSTATAEEPLRSLVSCGVVSPGLRLEIVDPTDRQPCKEGQVGEIWLSGDSITAGYWQCPEESESSFGASLASDPATRFLRTGDLGAKLGGELWVTGRLKDLLVIRGRNHYPQDLEATAASSHRAFEGALGAAFPWPSELGPEFIVVQEVSPRYRRFHRSAGDELLAALRRGLSEEHGLQASQLVVVAPGGIPRTPSGKVRRRQCRLELAAGALSVLIASDPPVDSISRSSGATASESQQRELGGSSLLLWLRASVAAKVGTEAEEVDPSQSLAALGLDSLGATELLADLERETGVALGLRSLLEASSLKDLAKHLEEAASASSGSRLTAAGRAVLDEPTGEIVLPLSPGQQALFFSSRLVPRSSVLHLASALCIEAPRIGRRVAPPRVLDALECVLARHGALRSRIIEPSSQKGGSKVGQIGEGRFDGEAMVARNPSDRDSNDLGHGSDDLKQWIRASAEAPVDFRFQEARSWSPSRFREALEEAVEKPLDLVKGPTLRCCLWHRPEGDILLLVVHHAVADLWSLTLLWRQILAQLRVPPSSAPQGTALKSTAVKASASETSASETSASETLVPTARVAKTSSVKTSVLRNRGSETVPSRNRGLRRDSLDSRERSTHGSFEDWLQKVQGEAWQQSLEASWPFWRQRLTPLPPSLDLPFDRPPPALRRYRGEILNRLFTQADSRAEWYSWESSSRVSPVGALGSRLEAVARESEATLFMTALGAVQWLLGRWSGQKRFRMGTLDSGRGSGQQEGLVGYWVNPLVLVADLRPEESFRDHLKRLREDLLEVFEHRHFPFPWLVGRLGGESDPRRPPLISVVVTVQAAPGDGGREFSPFILGLPGHGVSVSGLPVKSVAVAQRSSQYDLNLWLAPLADGRLGARLEYDTDLFDGTTAERFLRHLEVVLGTVASDPERRLSTLSFLPPSQRHQLVLEVNDTAVGRASRAGSMGLLGRIFQQASRQPEVIAVRGMISDSSLADGAASGSGFSARDLSYGELMEESARLAARFGELGVGEDDLVALLLDRSVEMVVCVVAVLRCGAAFLPLDPADPPQRLRSLLRSVHPRVVVAMGETEVSRVGCATFDLRRWAASRRVGDPRGARPPSAEGLLPEEGIGAAMLRPANHPDSLAYVLFTSGSTGQPKAAMNSHRGLLNRLRWMQRAYPIGPRDRILQKTPLTFDVSVWELLWPLMTGARLVLAPVGSHRDPQFLARQVARQGISVIHFVPSLLGPFLQEAVVSSLSSLRWVISSGEALSAELCRQFYLRMPPGARLENLYGPTEAAIDVSSWPCPSKGPWDSVPIGCPIDQTHLLLLDGLGDVAAVGAVGELAIGGANLGRGYRRGPRRTAESFRPDPYGLFGAGSRLYHTGDLARRRPDGCVLFLGRRDHQVKIRGVRIELGEVEAALTTHPAIGEAVVAIFSEDAEGSAQADDEASGGSSVRRFSANPRSNAGPARLAAYFTAVGEVPPGAALRSHLARLLPPAMIPSHWIPLAELPRTASGKLDRRRLPSPHRPALRSHPPVPPETPLQKQVAAVWTEVLGVADISIDDDFFALGGDSIRSLQIRSRLEAAGYAVRLEDIHRRGTIRSLAASLVPPLGNTSSALGVATAGGSGPTESKRNESSSSESGVLGSRPTEPFSLVEEVDRRRLPESLEDALPLARTQSGVIFHSQFDPTSPMYRDLLVCGLAGPYHRDLLTQSIQRAVDRHPMLRTAFDLANYSEPLQLVHRQAQGTLEEFDLSAVAGTSWRERLEAWIDQEMRRPLPWQDPPGLRFIAVLEPGQSQFAFALSFFDALLDGWSAASLIREILKGYDLLLSGDRLPSDSPAVSFREFVAAEVEKLGSSRARRRFSRILEEAPVSRLPRWCRETGTAGREGGSSAAAPTNLPVTLPAALRRGLEALARTLQVPVKQVLLAAHLLALGRLLGQDRVLTGLETHGRPEIPGSEEVLGMHMNILPFVVNLAGLSLVELVLEVATREGDLLKDRRFPFSEMGRGSSKASRENSEVPGGPARRLGDASQGRPGAVIESIFNFTHFHVLASLADLRRLKVQEAFGSNQTSFPLRAEFSRHPLTGELALSLVAGGEEAGRGELAGARLAAIAGFFRRSLEALSQGDATGVAAVSLLSPAERQQLLVEVNDTVSPRMLPPTLPRAFSVWARRQPESPALVGVEGGRRVQLTYREVAVAAQSLATRLVEAGAGRETVVAVLCQRSLGAVIGLLGILQAGAAYLPLDPRDPRERWTQLLEDSGAELLLLGAGFAPVEGSPPTLSLSPAPSLPAQSEVLQVEGSVAGPDDLAYVLYTSGSTGHPKGVEVTHGAIINLLGAMAGELEMRSGESFLALTQLTFDISLLELFGPLVTGGTVVLSSVEECLEADLSSNLGRKLSSGAGASWIDASWTGIHLVQATPSAWQALWAHGFRGQPGQRWLSGGESLEAGLSRDLSRGKTRLWNLYGPTEATVWATTWRVSPQASRVFLGRPLSNTQVYVVDPRGMPVPVGTTGELWLGGAGLARGYRREARLTAEFFVPDALSGGAGRRLYRTGDLVRLQPPENQLVFMGRKDHQLKIRGHRIEPGEIEVQLGRLPEVERSVVVARETAPGHTALVAYYTTGSVAPTSQRQLREALRRFLPAALIPSRFVLLDTFPLTRHGKIDRLQLPDPALPPPPTEVLQRMLQELEQLEDEKVNELLETSTGELGSN